MAIKNFLSMAAPSTSTTVYTVPANTYNIVKTITITNNYPSAVTFRLQVGGIQVAFDHAIQAYDTLVLKDLDIPMYAGNTIILSASLSGLLNFSISGIEGTTTGLDLPYVTTNGLLTTANATLLNADNTNDRLVKSLILANSSPSDINVNIIFGSTTVISAHKIKAKDTLIISLDFALNKSVPITGSAASTSSVFFGVVAMKVVQ